MKTNHKPTEAQIEAAKERRAALCRATAPFKKWVQMNRDAQAAELNGASHAEIAAFVAHIPAKFRDCFTLNACLEVIYREQTGQTEFHTFRDWKAKGYSVRKGEHGFMLWSTPKIMKFETGKTLENGDPEKETVERFAVAYVFHAGQVHQDEAAPVEAIG